MYAVVICAVIYVIALLLVGVGRLIDKDMAEFDDREQARTTEKTRSTKKAWTAEDAKSLRDLWGPSAECGLIKQMIKVIDREMDREIRLGMEVQFAVERAFAGWDLRERYQD